MITLILLGIILIYHILGMTVVSEYVETIEEQEAKATGVVVPDKVRKMIAVTWPVHVALSLFTNLGKNKGGE